MRIVIDTNLYISALINANSRQRLNHVLLNPDYTILLSDALLAELDEVMHRPKFVRYLSPTQIDQFMDLLLERSMLVRTVSV
ncbi:MAG: putative toxin-antitoxin system toxin component, PIN family, partial [Cytophagaceae bacterium]